MKIGKKGSQQITKNVTQTVEYEVKTFTSNVRNRSPMATNSYYVKRSPQRAIPQGTIDSGAGGEMIYIDPNEVNFRRTEDLNSQNYIIRSPGMNYDERSGNNYVSYERREIDTSQQIQNRIPPQYSMEIEQRKDRSRSPKTINIGESPQEAEYNIRTLNRGRSPKYSYINSPPENIERSYNGQGNIFLDPMQNSFQRQTDFKNVQDISQQNSREIKFSVNPRDLQEPIPGILHKMSPQGNVEGDSDSNSEKNDNNQIKDLKTQLDRRPNVIIKNDDGMVDGRQLPNELEKIEDLVRTREMQENITGEEVKKLVKQYVKAYDPIRGEDGNLISNSQTVFSSTKNDPFNDRYKVLQKMNKLSNILLSKRTFNQNTNVEGSPVARTYAEKSFDRNTLNNTIMTGKRTIKKNKNKFLYVSLAMLTSKGLNTEDRTILRRMRIDKGGVVDLAQEKLAKKDKFKIKKVKATGRGHTMINPKYREKAAKIVQAWWRERKMKYKKILEQIIKIQSVWRGKFIRKYVYDIIYMSYLNQKFLDIINKTLVNHVRPQVWDELFSRKKLIKDILGNLLESKDKKFTALRIRPYFRKWHAIANFLRRRIEKSERLVIRKGDEKQRKKILKKYLDEWILRTNLEKYIGKAKDAEEKRQKFFGALNLIDGLTNFSKRTVQKNTHEPITNYLRGLLKNKILKKIAVNREKTEKRNNTYLLKYYINRWKNNCNNEKFKDFKAGVFSKNVNHVHSRMDKITLKKYFDKWRRQLPQGRKLLDINDGAEILQRFVFRTTFPDPLAAFSEKIDVENKRETSLKLLIVKKRNLKDNLRDYFQRWKNNTIRLNDKDYRNNIFATLIKTILKNQEKRILSRKFNKWRQRPKTDIKKEMSKFRDFRKTIITIFKNHLIPEKKAFLEKLNKTRAERAIKKAGGKIFKNYGKKDKNLLRYYFYKWRKETKKNEIEDLHRQLLRYLINNKELLNKRNLLARYLYRWKLFTSDSKNYDNLDKLRNVLKGGDILHNMHHRRYRDLINRLYRKMGKDYRPKILYKLTKELSKPKSTLRECFDRWRRVQEKEKAKDNISNFKGLFVNKEVKRIVQRSDRDKLMKAFFRWRIMCKKPEEYYPRINNALEILTHKIKRDNCDEPFKKIQFTRNFTRPLNKIIKNYRNQYNRLLDGKMRNLFQRWRNRINDYNIKITKTNLIYRTKANIDKNMKGKLLAKYFTRWKLNSRKKNINIDFNKGIDILTELYKRPYRKTLFDIFKQKINNTSKKKGANELAKASDKHKKHLLHNALYRWYRGAMHTDPNRLKKIKTRLRRFIRHNEEEPRAKAFYKWRNKIRALQKKDDDILRAKKIISGQIKLNHLKNLAYAFSSWRKQIQRLREIYIQNLKNLLLKQIKTSQNVKEQVTYQERLRSALYKWRSKLVPVDYLDRLKRIRKGCKLFKLGLRRRDRRNIFDNVQNLAKANRKKFLLKKIVEILRPEIAKYHMKRCIDIWKSKLGDTQRMKNKIHTLFEDYVYSDKIHDGLFTEPKNQIIDLLNTHYNNKKDKAKKIADFIKGILKAPKNRDRMLATLKLQILVQKKENALNDVKKIQFIKLYRQTQKVKNDENSKIIQHFIKEKLRRYFDKRELVKKGVNIFDAFLKRKCIKNIEEEAKNNFMKKILRNGIARQENANKKILSDAFNNWRNKLPLLRQHQAANKIINLFRSIKSKNKLNNLRRRIEILISIHENNVNKSRNMLQLYLHNWLNRALMIKNNENATIIQKFSQLKLRLQKKLQAKDKLQKLFKRMTKHKLATVMERASRIIGGKGEVVYKALQDVLYKNPWDKFIERLKFTGKVNKLREVQPKIHEKIKNYYLPLALKKWKENTYDVTMKKAAIMQKFLRDQYAKKMERDKEKRELLLKEIVERLIINNRYKLQLPFSIWSKKSQLMKVNENVIKIQNAIRSHLAKNKQKDLSALDKWKKLIHTAIYKYTVQGLKNAGDHKVLKNNRKKILVQVLKQKVYTDGKSALRRYFDKWRQFNKYVNKCARVIENSYRAHKAIKEKNRLKRIKEILYKTVMKYDKTNNDQKRSKVRKWNNNVKLSNYNTNAKIIQDFIRPKLAKLLNDKFKKYFHDNAHKKTNKLLLLAAKIYKLQHALNRPSVQRFRNNLKKLADKNRIKDLLTKAVNNKNDKLNTLLLQKYLKKWNDKAQNLKNKEFDSASTIQRGYLSYKARKERDRLQKLRNILITAIIKKSNIANSKLYSYFIKWLNIARILAVNENAKIIQDFCREIQGKLNEQKELKKKLRIHNGLDKLFNIKIGAKYFFDKLRSARDKNVFKQFNDNLKKHKLTTVKDVFDKIRKTAFDNKLKTVLKIPQSLRIRILKRALDNWKNNATKTGKRHGAELIQKNLRIFLKKKKYENRKNILKDILKKLINKNSNVQQKAFRKWKDNARKLLEKAAKTRAALFIVNKYKTSGARKNWTKLANLLKLKDRNKDLFTLINKIKQYQTLKKLKKPFVKYSRETVIRRLKENKKKENIKNKLIIIIPKFERQNQKGSLKYYLHKWINQVGKKIERENKLMQAMDEINKRKLINNTNKITSVNIIKKIFHDIPYGGAKIFFKKLRENCKNKNKYMNLEKDILKANDNLKNQHKKNALNKILKIFVYKNIENMAKICDNHVKNRVKPTYQKEFLKNLYVNMTEHSSYNYANKQESTSKANIVKLNFRRGVNKKPESIVDKQAPIKKILPSFIHYLENKIKARKSDVLDKMKDKYRASKFCYLFRKYNDKTIKEPKEEMVKKLKKEVKYAQTRPIYQIKLFKLLRKKYIREITTKLVEPSRLYNLFYLINVTKMHKQISQQRFFRELIRKWRFISFTKKMARKKLELMYKNLHASYLQMADEIFGDDEVNPSVIKEFEMFGNNVGMFTGQEPEVNEEIGKKYYATVDKRYVFNKMPSNDEGKMRKVYEKTIYKQVVEEEEEEEEINKIKKDKTNKVEADGGSKTYGYSKRYHHAK